MQNLKNTNTIVEDIIKLEFNEADDTSFKIYYNEFSYVQQGRKIGEYQNRLGVKTPIISNFFGKILKIDKEEKTIVIEKCKHEIILYRLCATCGCEMPKSKPFISIHSQLSFSESKAKEEEEAVVKKYLDSKKLILLLDIDNTFLHACPFNLSKEEFESLKLIHGWEIAEILIALPFVSTSTPSSIVKQRIVVKFRPMLKSFLENIRDKYEIYIYTHATKEYAEEVIKYLNKTLEYEYFSLQRLVARTDVSIEAKSIKRIFPTTDDMVVIVDDRTDVWGDDTKNIVNLVPYFFFYDEKFFKISTKYKVGKDEDYVLFSVEKLISFISEAFYYSFDKFNFSKTSVKNILWNKVRSIFGDINFNISGIYGTDVDLYDTKHGYMIEYLGGNLYEEYDDDINIIITREYKKTKKIRDATNSGKMIIHEGWLDFCMLFFCRIKEENYLLTLKMPKLDRCKLNQSFVFGENKKTIEDFYSVEEQQLKKFFEQVNKENAIKNSDSKIESNRKKKER